MLDRKKNHNHFKHLIEHLRQTGNDASELVEILITRKRSPKFEPINCFESAEAQDFKEVFERTVPLVNNAQILCWPMLEGPVKAKSYLPISAFRAHPSSIWGVVDKLRIFLSSGTTSGSAGRSRSPFSENGLRFYKAASLTSFLGVLESRVLPFSGDFLNISLISLVPPVEKWPDSSLAQMMGWFSEVWPTKYADEVSVESFQTIIDSVATTQRPICVIGTAFHLVNFLDEWEKRGLTRYKLPAGSIIVETGGTKGKSRTVKQDDLYGLITQGFGVERSSIIGEYGMCELASQAWKFTAASSPNSLQDLRSFKFPWWVETAVMTSPFECLNSGEGALLVKDHARVDLQSNHGSVPIQTEDLVKLESDGSFVLLGRVPNAPLKGCSILAEEALSTTLLAQSFTAQTRSLALGPMVSLNNELLQSQAKKAATWLEELSADPEAKGHLTRELQSSWLADMALSDLIASKPNNFDDFIYSARRATGNAPTASRWLFIAPSSHSLALVHPITTAITLGLSIRIRVPSIAGIPPNETFLYRAIKLAKKLQTDITLIPPEWRLGSEELRDGEHILVFGDDGTCKQFDNFAPGRVKAFGHITSLTLAQFSDLKDPATCNRIVYDQIALRQRGCLSSRGLLIIGGESDSICQSLSTALPKKLIEAQPTPAELAARSIELVRLSQLGYSNKSWSAKLAQVPQVLIATKTSSLETLADELMTALSRLDLVIPVLVLPENTREIEIIKKLPKHLSVRALSVSSKTKDVLMDLKKSQFYPKNLGLTCHGSLDQPLFDGTHLGSPFFATSS